MTFKKQPRTSIKPNKIDHQIIRVGWLLILINLLLVIAFYTDLPKKIPTHFNLKGVADGYGSKSSLWGILMIAALLYYGLNLFIKKVPPHQYNYPVQVTDVNAPKLYGMSIRMMVLLNLLVAFVFLLITAHIIGVSQFSFSLSIPVGITITALTVLPFFFIFKMFKIPK